MRDQVSLFAVSGSVNMLSGIKNLLEKENGFHFSGVSGNIPNALKHFDSSKAALNSNKLLFVDNYSSEKILTVDFLNYIHNESSKYRIKSIVYTNNGNNSYLNELIELKVNSIIIDRETPLKDFLFLSPYYRQNIKPQDMHFHNIGNKFMETIKSVSAGLNCYDGQVISIILRRYEWNISST